MTDYNKFCWTFTEPLQSTSLQSQTDVNLFLQRNDINYLAQKTLLIAKRKHEKSLRYPPMHVEEFKLIMDDTIKKLRLSIAQIKNLVKDGILIPGVADIEVNITLQCFSLHILLKCLCLYSI